MRYDCGDIVDSGGRKLCKASTKRAIRKEFFCGNCHRTIEKGDCLAQGNGSYAKYVVCAKCSPTILDKIIPLNSEPISFRFENGCFIWSTGIVKAVKVSKAMLKHICDLCSIEIPINSYYGTTKLTPFVKVCVNCCGGSFPEHLMLNNRMY